MCSSSVLLLLVILELCQRSLSFESSAECTQYIGASAFEGVGIDPRGNTGTTVFFVGGRGGSAKNCGFNSGNPTEIQTLVVVVVVRTGLLIDACMGLVRTTLCTALFV